MNKTQVYSEITLQEYCDFGNSLCDMHLLRREQVFGHEALVLHKDILVLYYSEVYEKFFLLVNWPEFICNDFSDTPVYLFSPSEEVKEECFHAQTLL